MGGAKSQLVSIIQSTCVDHTTARMIGVLHMYLSTSLSGLSGWRCGYK